MMDMHNESIEMIREAEFYCGACYNKLEQVGTFLQCPCCRQAY